MPAVNLNLSPSARFLLLTAAFVVVVAGMRAAQPLLAPFLIAGFIAVLATPPMYYLRRHDIGTGVALLVVVATVVAAGLVLGAMIGNSMDDFSGNLPGYQAKLKQQMGQAVLWLREHKVNIPDETLTTYLDPAKAMSMAGKMLSGVGGVLTNTFLILLTVIFILFEASGFPAKLHAALRNPEASLARFSDITSNINQYMVIKTSTSLLTGVLVALMLFFLGVDYPVMWGTLAFVLNYVPNIGSVIAAVPAVLLALIQFGIGPAVVTIVGYTIINVVVGNVIEPRYMGQGLGLSALVVFVSLVFWGWVLGPVGMFLSVPLTMTLKIALDANTETRPIAIMLGPAPKE